MADKKKLSMDEILAACRADDGGGAPSESKATPTPSTPASAPASSGGASDKKPGEMSVADILAAARGGASDKKGENSPKPTPAKKPASKPAAPKAKATPKAASTGPKDTSSILAAARSQSKPGPLSKAEAAARGITPPSKGKRRIEVPPMPVKPSYAKAKPASKVAPARRGFITVFFGSFLAVGFSLLSITNLLWLLGAARFMFPNILTEPPSRFKVGFPADFTAGAVATKFKAQFGVWVVNSQYDGKQEIYALRSVCTHLGCTPNWLEAEQKFKCPCHGSGFYKDGINFEGPAPRPLERYAISIASDGQLEIDKSQLFQEELGQWSDSACYVQV